MTEKYELLRSYEANQKQSHHILKERGYDLSEELIWQILQIHFDTGYLYYSEILHKKLSVEEIVEITAHYLDNQGRVGEVTSEVDFDLPPEEDSFEKAIVKFKGIWQIHKNDQDPFPSIPHAHNYEKGLKVHLGNGDIYRKKQKIKSMKKGDLVEFRKEIMKKMPELILPTLTA